MSHRNILFGIITSLLFASCGFIKPVTVTNVSNFRTVNPLTQPEFKFDVGLKNPNNFGVTLKKMEIGVSVGDPLLAKISILEGTRITRKESILVPVSLSPSVDEISTLFMSGIGELLSGKSNQVFQIKGEIVIRKFIFSKKYKIKESIKL